MEAAELYRVIENQEEQLSIWPVGRELPIGWRDVGITGQKDECMAYIDENWKPSRREPMD